MFLKYKVVLAWVICLSYKMVLTGCEVGVWVNRDVVDSFRVGKDGCTYDSSVCTNSHGTCIKRGGECLCNVFKPNFRNSTTRPGVDKSYGCLKSDTMRAGVGGYDNCPLGPFQLIPYNKGKLAEKFSDIDNRRAMMKSCSLRNVLVKFPDNAAEMELQWLDESYVGLNVFNNELSFKWKKSVPNLQGTIITFNLSCEVQIPKITADHSYQTKCMRAKVLGKWSADTVSVPSEPTVTSTKPKSSQITTETISPVTVTTETTAEPKSTASASSDEACSNSNVSNKIFIALFCISLVATVVLGIIVGFLWKYRKRMQDKNLKIRELETIDEQRSATTGDDISTYDEVVTKSGIHNERVYDESLSSSRHNNNERLSGHQYEEPSNYEPLRRNPLQDQSDEHNYQSLTTSQEGK